MSVPERQDASASAAGFRLLAGLPRDSGARAVVVTLLVCAVCSAVIAASVAWLRPLQQANRERERTSRIRAILADVPGVEAMLGQLGTARLDARLIDLATGEADDDDDPAAFDARQAARDPQRSIALPPARDPAGIGRRAHHALVFEVRDGDRLRLVVLPVYGAGYASTIHGYLALDADLASVRGIDFVEHGETPGLGAEIESPQWRAQWVGKRLRDASGRLRIGVARETVDPRSESAAFEVDGIAGATRTGAGVTDLLRFWLGPDGFGPYLERLGRESGATGEPHAARRPDARGAQP